MNFTGNLIRIGAGNGMAHSLSHILGLPILYHSQCMTSLVRVGRVSPFFRSNPFFALLWQVPACSYETVFPG
jgi:hypothetical protein